MSGRVDRSLLLYFQDISANLFANFGAFWRPYRIVTWHARSLRTFDIFSSIVQNVTIGRYPMISKRSERLVVNGMFSRGVRDDDDANASYKDGDYNELISRVLSNLKDRFVRRFSSLSKEEDPMGQEAGGGNIDLFRGNDYNDGIFLEEVPNLRSFYPRAILLWNFYSLYGDYVDTTFFTEATIRWWGFRCYRPFV